MYWIVFGLTLTVVFRTSSQQGCSPALTCDLTSCPMVPSSTCQVDMDSCSVSLVDDEGNVVNCTDCPPGSTPADCPRPLPCESATCPSSPSALCVNTFCDSCKPLFVDENGNLLDEAACLVDVGIEFPPLPSVTCVNPPTPTFGFVADPRPLYLVGETLSFICPEETMLQGSQNTSCLDTGLFTEIDPNTACVDNFQVQCSVMAPVDGFVVGDADLVRLGTTVQYECNENFTLIGERSAVCEDTGMLSYLVPICINCPPSASCEITTCPNVQNFSCSINLASCEVEVFDPTGNLLSEEDCRGACPLSVSCDLATCPNVPDFTCSVNQATCVVETFDENGNLLSDEACGRECPIGVPLAGCQGLLPCEREACPGVTGATCTNNFCGECNAVFTDSDGNVLSDDDCRQTCLLSVSCDLATCPNVPDFTCSVNQATCVVETFDENGNLLSDAACGRECPIGVPLAGCQGLLPCEREACPGVTGATCTNNFCGGCNAVFTDSDGNVLSDDDCRQTCPLSVSCDLATCPNVPDFTCSVNQATCVVETFDENGNLLSDEACGRECPIGVPLAGCQGLLPCEREACPGVTGATCTNNFCGGCNAVFTDSDGNVLSDDDCNLACPLSVSCDLATCPNVPNFTCSVNQATCVVETFDENGNLLSDEACGRECPIGVPLAGCQGLLPCEREACPGVTGTTCTNNFCGGCNAVFTDSDGNVLSEEDCRLACPLSVSCDLATCPNVPNFTCSVNQATCVVETFDENGDLLSDEACGRECPVGVPLASCSEPLPCESLSCPSVQGATCTNNFCGGCSAVFTDSDGNVLSNEDCATDNCPSDRPRYLCHVPPCERYACPGYSGAVCTNDYCGGCRAVFRGRNGNVLNEFQCRSKDSCPLERPRVACPAVPCDIRSCPAVPGATCESDYCGGCHAVFSDSQGKVYSREECNPADNCPRLFNSGNPASFQASCLNGYRVGSRCRLSCQRGYTLQGGVYQVECMRSRLWSPSLRGVTCYKPSCPPVPDSMYFNSRCLFGTTVGSSCIIQCKNSNPPRTWQITCLYNQQWSRSPSSITCRPRVAQCPIVQRNPSKLFAVSCSDGGRVGSRCDARCPSNYEVRGTKSITCQSSGRWSGAFSFTLCVSRAISHCTTQTCSYSPCSGVRCPAFPQARCLPSCYGCGVHFYINTRRLTPSQCAAQGLFSCSTRHCGNRCRFSRCPTNAYAHCRIHCDCSIAYYDLRTSQRVTCFAAPVGK